jgi:hypothetical protein
MLVLNCEMKELINFNNWEVDEDYLFGSGPVRKIALINTKIV